MTCVPSNINQPEGQRVRLSKEDTTPPLPYDVMLEIDEVDTALRTGSTYLICIGLHRMLAKIVSAKLGAYQAVDAVDGKREIVIERGYIRSISVLARVLSMEWLPMT